MRPQIGRTTARTLGLNEDLTEAFCLAHDIGHPPFGHAGEDALEAALDDHGGFDHNAHTLRTLMLLESPYPCFAGLNLSWEMLEGLAKHNGPIVRPGWAMREVDALFPLDLASHSSLEAQLAAIGSVAGAGPAYVARYIDALAKAGVERGLSQETATTIATETVLGTAWMATATRESMDDIVRRVASPNGTTEAGLAVLGRDDVLDELVSLTISAAARRGEELAEEAKGAKLASEAPLA